MPVFLALWLINPLHAQETTFESCRHPEPGQSLLDWTRACDSSPERWLVSADSSEVGLLSPYGAYLSPSCVAAGRREELESALERIMTEAFSMIQSCAGRFPQLPYTEDLVHVLRRAKIECSDTEDDAAFTDNGGCLAYMVPPGGGRMVPEEHRFVIYIPNSLEHFVSLARTNGRSAASILLHEALHHIRADNFESEEHRQRWRAMPLEGHACEDNVLDDRIALIQTMCGAGDGDFVRFLGERFRECRDRCRRTFMAARVPRNRFDILMNSRAAGRLCDLAQERLDAIELGRQHRREEILVLLTRVLRDGGGLQGGIPDYYLNALPADERKALAILFTAGVPAACGSLLATQTLADFIIPVAMRDEMNALFSGNREFFNLTRPASLPASCPLSSEYYVPAVDELTRRGLLHLLDFHNQEEQLQQSYLGVLIRLLQLNETVHSENQMLLRVQELDEIRTQVRTSRESACVPEGFRPKLCRIDFELFERTIDEFRDF